MPFQAKYVDEMHLRIGMHFNFYRKLVAAPGDALSVW